MSDDKNPMLAPHEFRVGPLATATGMTLVMRRHAQEASFLVSAATDVPAAIFLDGEFRFAWMPTADNTSWHGVLVPNVTIEVDATSILDAGRGRPLGVLVRRQSELAVAAQREPRGQASLVPIVSGLPPCHENESAAFSRWQIVLGEGLSKRVLFEVDAAPKPSD